MRESNGRRDRWISHSRQDRGIVAVIPTREGNGAIDMIRSDGNFAPPKLKSLEEVIDAFAGDPRGVVTADLWDLEMFSECDVCFANRKERLKRINILAEPQPAVECGNCREI